MNRLSIANCHSRIINNKYKSIQIRIKLHSLAIIPTIHQVTRYHYRKERIFVLYLGCDTKYIKIHLDWGGVAVGHLKSVLLNSNVFDFLVFWQQIQIILFAIAIISFQYTSRFISQSILSKLLIYIINCQKCKIK